MQVERLGVGGGTGGKKGKEGGYGVLTTMEDMADEYRVRRRRATRPAVGEGEGVAWGQ